MLDTSGLRLFTKSSKDMALEDILRLIDKRTDRIKSQLNFVKTSPVGSLFDGGAWIRREHFTMKIGEGLASDTLGIYEYGPREGQAYGLTRSGVWLVVLADLSSVGGWSIRDFVTGMQVVVTQPKEMYDKYRIDWRDLLRLQGRIVRERLSYLYDQRKLVAEMDQASRLEEAMLDVYF